MKTLDNNGIIHILIVNSVEMYDNIIITVAIYNNLKHSVIICYG